MVSPADPESWEIRAPEVPTDEQLLNKAAGFLRHLLSQHADLRITPTLRFKYDNSIRHGRGDVEPDRST